MFFRRKDKKEKIDPVQDKSLSESAEKNSEVSAGAESSDNKIPDIPLIKTEILPEDSKVDGKLVEIRDSKVIARINNLIPGFFQAGNAIANSAMLGGGNIYKAIIPAGQTLSKSAQVPGAFRGIYHNVNGKIAGQANLVEVGGTASAVANAASAAMSVASMVVGQYYMSQINDKLEDISNGISKISDFQNDEFESKVKTLLALVKNISDFQIEIIDSNETRQLHKISIERFWADCIQLLEQTCLAINRYTSQDENIKFEDYEKELPEIEKWFIYQNALFATLTELSELRYTLSLGEMSRAQCNATLKLYSKQVEDSQAKLRNWHRAMCEHFRIDINTMQQKKKGFAYLPGIIKKEWKYKALDEDTSNLIIDQISRKKQSYDTTDYFSLDIQLIEKENKLYYVLPEKRTPRYMVETPYEVD